MRSNTAALLKDYRRMHEGHWDKQGYMGFELSGATLGVVGCGSCWTLAAWAYCARARSSSTRPAPACSTRPPCARNRVRETSISAWTVLSTNPSMPNHPGRVPPMPY